MQAKAVEQLPDHGGTADDIEVVFRPDPPPAVVRRRPTALTAVWVVAVVAGVVAVAVGVWRLVDEPATVEPVVLGIGEMRSLSDGGAPVELRCERRSPTVFGEPCLRDADAVRDLLAGRDVVQLVINVASAPRPTGVLRCVEVRMDSAGREPAVERVPCPELQMVPASPR